MSPHTSETPKEEVDPPKKKRRVLGTFPCPDCTKVFTRADHLSRHFLNHKPKEVFVCEYTITDHTGKNKECGKTFVRRDLRERHYRRHLAEKSDTLSKKCADSLTHSPTQSPSTEFPTLLPTSERPAANILQTEFSPGISAALKEKRSVQFGTLFDRSSHNHEIARSIDIVHNNKNMQSNSMSSLSYLPNSALIDGQNMTSVQQMAGLTSDSYHRNALTNHQQSTVNDQLSNILPPGNPNSSGNPNGLINPTYPPPTTNFENSRRDVQRNATTIPYSEGDIISWLFEDTGSKNTDLKGNLSMTPKSGFGFSPSMSYYATSPNVNNVIPTQETQYLPQPIDSLSKGGSNEVQNFYRPETQNGSMLYGTNQIQPPNGPVATQITPYPQSSDPNEATWTPFYYPAPKDLLFNNGLQDMNYFFNNDNPLEDLINTSPNDSPNGVIGIVSSTVSSSSPSHSNDSFTPKSINEVTGNDYSLDLFKTNAKAFATVFNTPKNKQIYINPFTLSRMLRLIPSLNENELRNIFPTVDGCDLNDNFSFFLQCYWETFQPKFSIIHRPSFSAETAEPLLLLAMICIGSMYSASSSLFSKQEKMCPEFKFCMVVMKPLRFTLFQHPEFKSPVKVWILQTLNLLEWCEKNYLLREMHERAHIHHGTTVQLLRRSPFLGGNPGVANQAATSASDTATSGGEEDNSDGVSDLEDKISSDRVLFQKWVHSESMKRITFFTFYLDVIDYVKFRHNPQIPFFQLQLLNLPCDEEQLWNNDEVTGSFQKVVKRQKKLHRFGHILGRATKDNFRIRPGMNFLSAMKRLLKPLRERAIFGRTSIFVKNILIGGLASLMHLMQQTEFQNNFTSLVSPADNKRNSKWKEVLMKSLDSCESELFSHSITPYTDSLFPTHLVRCKFPMYHLLQIITLADINHYDIAIFGGLPRNMSVDATTKDQKLVQRKLHSIWNSGHWMKSVNDLANVRSVIHCYWLLWKIMLSPMDENAEHTYQQWAHSWQVEYDFFDCMYAVSVATLVLWCYTFATCGPESQNYASVEAWPKEDLKNYAKMAELSKENAYQYLARIRYEFVQVTKPASSDEIYVLHLKSSQRNHLLPDTLKAYSRSLPSLPNKQNISGLCFLVGTTLLNSQWEVIRENAKLIINCGFRSIGKQNVHCSDIFDNEFK